jgi:hypothetical protein
MFGRRMGRGINVCNEGMRMMMIRDRWMDGVEVSKEYDLTMGRLNGMYLATIQ